MDYKEIEDQALDVVQLLVPEVTTWTRDWTNAARKALQRSIGFPESISLHPIESDLGSVFLTTAGTRTVEAPLGFYEFVAREGDLMLVEDGQHKDIDLWPVSAILDRYDLDATGKPEVFYQDFGGNGTTRTFYLFPKPDAAYQLRLHGYFYLADLADGDGGVDGVEDFLTEFDPILLRDMIIREAYVTLEMWDSAAELFVSIAGRSKALDHDSKLKQLGQDMTLRPSFEAGRGQPSSRMQQGYSFWPRRRR